MASGENEEPKVGDLVWAKVMWHPVWPAIVLDHPLREMKETKRSDRYMLVYFFGSVMHGWPLRSKVECYREGQVRGPPEANSALQAYQERKTCAPYDRELLVELLKEAEKAAAEKKAADVAKKPVEKKPTSSLRTPTRAASTSTQPTKRKRQSASAQETQYQKRRYSSRRSAMENTQPTKRKRQSASAQETQNQKRRYSSRRSAMENTHPESTGKSADNRQGETPRDVPDHVETLTISVAEKNVVQKHHPEKALEEGAAVDHDATGPLIDGHDSNVDTAPQHVSVDAEDVTLTLQDDNEQPARPTIGFLGGGVIAAGIAKTIVMKSGCQVVVWSSNPKECQDLLKAGAKQGKTPSEVVQEADITISCLDNPDIVKEILDGCGGVLQSMTNGKGYVEMSCINDPEVSRERATATTSKGGRYLEAQIQGTCAQAEEGTLFILAAGDMSLFQDCQTCFQAISNDVHYVGKEGTATKMLLDLRKYRADVVRGSAECLVQFGNKDLRQEQASLILQSYAGRLIASLGISIAKFAEAIATCEDSPPGCPGGTLEIIIDTFKNKGIENGKPE